MGHQATAKQQPATAAAIIPPQAARSYITDMLGELCQLAQDTHQKDLHILLKLTAQAARNTSAD